MFQQVLYSRVSIHPDKLLLPQYTVFTHSIQLNNNITTEKF